MVDKSDIERMVAEVDRENSLFADKSPLDPFRPASEIVGREREAKELVRTLAGGRGFAAPFVSVYGRSGSGKSSVVRFVCDSLLESGNVIAYAFANLRMARTVAGCAMLVLEEVPGSRQSRVLPWMRRCRASLLEPRTYQVHCNMKS